MNIQITCDDYLAAVDNQELEDRSQLVVEIVGDSSRSVDGENDDTGGRQLHC